VKRTPLTRRTPLRRRTSGRARPGVPLAIWCEAVTPACTGLACHRHHVLPRSAGGDDTTPYLDCCGDCHRFIHANPARSYDEGWLLRRTTA
jgi:hypothetical protein